MHTFEYILVLLAAVLVSNLIGQRFPRISTPLIQVALGGILVAFPIIPFEENGLDPALFLILFIAPMLFEEAKRSDKQALWSFKAPILSLAIGLVFATVMSVGFTLNWLVPSIPLAAAFAFAAALAPTDVVAVLSLNERSTIPHDQHEILKGEGLLNDAASIVSFQFAIAAVLTASFSLANASFSFIIMFIGGLIVGIGLMIFRYLIMRFVTKSGMESSTFFVLFELITPCLVYLVAEVIHVSGIIAVVAAGITYSFAPRGNTPVSARNTIVSSSAWSVIIFTLNGLCFLMLGAQLPHVVSDFLKREDINFGYLSLCMLAILAVILVVRFAWALIMHRNMDLTVEGEDTGTGGDGAGAAGGGGPDEDLEPADGDQSEWLTGGEGLTDGVMDGGAAGGVAGGVASDLTAELPSRQLMSELLGEIPDVLAPAAEGQHMATSEQYIAAAEQQGQHMAAATMAGFEALPSLSGSILMEAAPAPDRLADGPDYEEDDDTGFADFGFTDDALRSRLAERLANRKTDRRQAHADPHYWRHHLFDALQLTIAGPKGSITLALVFGIPLVLPDGSGFPERDIIMFIASGVILMSLTLTSFVLPLISPKKTHEEHREDEVEVMVGICRQVIHELLENANPDDLAVTNEVVRQYDERIQRLQTSRTLEDSEELQLRSQIVTWERQHTLELISEGRVGTFLGMVYLNNLSRQLARLEHHSTIRESLKAFIEQMRRLARRWQIVRGARRENPAYGRVESRLQLRGLQLENLNCVLEHLESLQHELDVAEGETPMSPQLVTHFVFNTNQQLSRSSRRFRSRMQMLTDNAEGRADRERREMRLSMRALEWEREAISDAVQADRISRQTAKEMFDSLTAMELDIEGFLE